MAATFIGVVNSVDDLDMVVWDIFVLWPFAHHGNDLDVSSLKGSNGVLDDAGYPSASKVIVKYGYTHSNLFQIPGFAFPAISRPAVWITNRMLYSAELPSRGAIVQCSGPLSRQFLPDPRLYCFRPNFFL